MLKLLLILTLCGDPVSVIVTDGKIVDAVPYDKVKISGYPIFGVRELWTGKCA